MQPDSRLSQSCFIGLIPLVVGVALASTVVAVHGALLTQHNDLGNHLQALASAASGDLRMIQHNTIDDVIRSRLGVHSNWILLPAAAVWRVWPAPEAFLLMSVGAALAAAVAMGLSTVRHGAMAGSAGAFAVILHPWVHDAVLSDGHLTTWAAACVALAIAARRRRPHLAFGCAVLGLLVKEDMPFVALAATVPLWFEGQRRGAASLAVAAVVVLGLDAVAFRLAGGPAATHRFDWLQTSSLTGIVEHLVNPAVVRLPLFVLLSGGLLAGRGARWLLPAIPIVGLCMLDEGAYMTRLAGTYYLPVVVVCVVAAVEAGVAAGGSPRRLLVLALLTLLSSLVLSTLPTLASVTPRPELVAAIHTVVDKAGLSHARICVQNNLGPHLDPLAPVVAFPRCRPEDPRLFLLRSTAPPDDGLTLRSDTATLLGAPLPAVAGEIDRLVQGQARITRHHEGVWLFEPAAPTPASDDDLQALERDLERFLQELASRTRERSGLAEGFIRFAVGGKT